MSVLTRERYVIAPDRRGTGASSQDVSDFGLDAQVADLVAVTDATVDGAADVIGWFDGAPITIAFAARYPERVRKMVLWHPFIDGAHYLAPERVQALTALARTDWTLALHTLARIWSPRGTAEDLRVLVRGFRERLTPDAFIRSLEAVQATNVEDEAPRVQAETLVLFPREAGFSPRHAQDAASLIPRATIRELDQTAGFAKGEAGPAAILDFLCEREAMAAAPPRPPAHGTAVILFADVVDSTATAGRLGNVAFRERTRQLEEALRGVIRGCGGSPVEGRTLGDGVLGVFTSAAQAIAAALECEQHADTVGLQLHLGIHAGDVIREADNVSGMAVSIAARISDLTAPNEILVSSTVRDLARASTDVAFEDRGEFELKGVGEAVRVYAVRAREAS